MLEYLEAGLRRLFDIKTGYAIIDNILKAIVAWVLGIILCILIVFACHVIFTYTKWVLLFVVPIGVTVIFVGLISGMLEGE